MADKRTILFLSADPFQADRRQEEEYQETAEALQLSEHRDQFQLVHVPAVRDRELRRELLKEKPHILHLAGSSDEKGIFLESRGEKAHSLSPAVLADLLSIFKGELHWVILSGCFKPAQASAISEHIDNVIGLEESLTIPQRINATTAIYDAIGSGKEDPLFVARFARNAAMMHGGVKANFHLYQQGKPVDLDNDKGPGDDAPEIELPPISEVVSHHQAYRCDRTLQNKTFTQIYERSHEAGEKPQPFYFFLLPGPDPQSHRGLVSRFYEFYLKDPDEPEVTPRYQVLLTGLKTLEAYQDAIRQKLLEELRLTRLLRLPDEQEMTAAYGKLLKRGLETVTIEIRVRSSEWKDFTPKLIDWFVNEYCRVAEEKLNVYGPEFYFFLNVIYDDKADHEILVDTIRGNLPQLRGCYSLAELAPVEKQHILDWIVQHITTNGRRKLRLWARYFPENWPQYDMEEVELRLDTMILNEPKDT
jgi:hypothetical protein